MLNIEGSKVGVLHFPVSGATLVASEESGAIKVAVSITGHGDQWSRKLGRTIALGRLFCKRGDVRGRYVLPTGELFSEGRFNWDALVDALIASKPITEPDRFIDRLSVAVLAGE